MSVTPMFRGPVFEELERVQAENATLREAAAQPKKPPLLVTVHEARQVLLDAVDASGNVAGLHLAMRAALAAFDKSVLKQTKEGTL